MTTVTTASPPTLNPNSQRTWAAPIIDGLRQRVSQWAKAPVMIPPALPMSGWAHNFTCRTCAERLPWDRQAPTIFTCTACHTVHGHAGDQTDNQNRREAWIYELNFQHITIAREACILAECTGDTLGLDFAKQILVGYAQNYSSYQVHGRWAGKGRLQGQGLDESVWMLPACHVYDVLLQRGQLSDAEQHQVQKMFGAAIDLLLPQISQIHNIHVWMAGAISALADRTGDANCSNSAAAREQADVLLQRNMDQGILADGSWFECAPHYHYYTVEAFLTWAAACQRIGRTPFGHERVRSMLRAPLAYERPDHQVALYNDGWPHHQLASRALFYEQAEGLFGGFHDILHHIYTVVGGTRDSVEAAFFGPDQIIPQPYTLPRCQVVDGIAVVRRGPWVAMIKANPDGGGHDHPDKPALDIFAADNSFIAADLGNPGYGNSLHKGWFKTTPSHNTVMIDDRDHGHGAAEIVAVHDDDDCTRIHARDATAYAGVTIDRHVTVHHDYIIDEVVVTADRDVTATWYFHALAAINATGQRTPATFSANNYLRDHVTISPATAHCEATWTATSGRRLCAHSSAPLGRHQRWGTAQGTALPATESVDLLIAEAQGPQVRFTTVFAWDSLPHISEQAEAVIINGQHYARWNPPA